ncbi:hypothetical protein CNR22_03055 [Sphingobacteriaceae bacterium]|nr:hypothetical protein CNR22_03055 [Sphingobacteriaceae bacterium]
MTPIDLLNEKLGKKFVFFKNILVLKRNKSFQGKKKVKFRRRNFILYTGVACCFFKKSGL